VPASIARSNSFLDWRAGRALLIALFVSSALLGRFCYLARPFDSDGAIFIYQGKLVSEGGRYCYDFIDNKFPTVGLMTSFFWRIWDAWWPGYVLSGALMSAAACLLLARAARRQFGNDHALPAAMMAVVFLNFSFAVFGGFQLETIQVFFASIAAAAALEALSSDPRRADAFVVGLAAGCAAMLKPTGLGVLCAFAAAAGWRHKREPAALLRMLIPAACGCAIPLSVSLLYLIASGTLTEMPALYRQIQLYASSSAWQRSDAIKPLLVLGILAFPPMVRFCVFRRAKEQAPTSATRYQIGFLVIWLVIEFAGVIAQRRMYAYHFLVLVPPAVLLFAALPRRASLIPLTAALAPMAILSTVGGFLAVARAKPPGRLAVSDYLSARMSVGETVWRDDFPRLLLETGLRPASRVPLTFLFANYDAAPLEYAQMIVQDLARSSPRYVVLPADLDRYVQWHAGNILELERFPQRQRNYVQAWNEIRAFVDSRYVRDRQIGVEQVWRRQAPQAQADLR
jgi:hypothetical protein